MLVISRRENDRISFPALGISIEVIRTSKARATLGINAPEEIRVVREELLDEFGQIPGELGPTPDPLWHSARSQACKTLGKSFASKLDHAAERLELAQMRLVNGNANRALTELAIALTELDKLRSQVEAGLNQHNAPPSWKAPETVAESGSTYAIAAADDDDDHRKPDRRKVLLVGEDHDDRSTLSYSLQADGYSVEETSLGLSVVYELSRHEPPSVVVLCTDDYGNDSAEETKRQILGLSKHHRVPIINVSHNGRDASDDTTTIWLQQRSDVASLVRAIQQSSDSTRALTS